MLTLYENPISPYGRKVKTVLYEKNVPFESRTVDLLGGEQRQPDFLRLNPFHRVPVLCVGGTALFESTAINEYLEEKYPKPSLLPADLILRAEARAWEEIGDADLGRVLAALVRQNFERPDGPDPSAVRALEAETTEVVRALDERLDGRDFVAGVFSLADIGLGAHLASLRMLGVAVAGFARVERWFESIAGRESFRKAEPPADFLTAMMDRLRARSG